MPKRKKVVFIKINLGFLAILSFYARYVYKKNKLRSYIISSSYNQDETFKVFLDLLISISSLYQALQRL